MCTNKNAFPKENVMRERITYSMLTLQLCSYVALWTIVGVLASRLISTYFPEMFWTKLGLIGLMLTLYVDAASNGGVALDSVYFVYLTLLLWSKKNW